MKTQDENAKLKYYTASQWQLIWWRFRKHRLSIIGMTILGIFIIFALFPEFFAPYSATERNGESVLCPPSKIVFKNAEGKYVSADGSLGDDEVKLTVSKNAALEIKERVPIQMPATPNDLFYLQTKEHKMGHLVDY